MTGGKLRTEKMKKGNCEVCGWRPPPLYPKITHKLLNAHHVVHRSRGGPTEEDNLLTLCPNHHAIAHALTGGAKTTATSLLPSPVTSEALLDAMRAIDADPDGWIATRHQRVINKSVGKESLFDTAPEILKPRDLAIILDTSPDTVNDMARRGILKGYKVGNHWRFRREDVERIRREDVER